MNNMSAASNVGAGSPKIVKGRDGGQNKLHRMVVLIAVSLVASD